MHATEPIYMLIIFIIINVLLFLFINNDDISNQNVPNMLYNRHGFYFINDYYLNKLLIWNIRKKQRKTKEEAFLDDDSIFSFLNKLHHGLSAHSAGIDR